MPKTSPLETKLASLPTSPGVYLMKDSRGKVIYVGKAASLRSRVRSYFQSPEGMAPRIKSLAGAIADFEVIQTATESEAFLAEDSLIKQHQPLFNIRLRDDKRYPYLQITDEPFPRVKIVRRRGSDRARYFGPYTNAKAMRATLKLGQKLFPIRTCNLDLPLKTPRRPCLNYHIGRCVAPCAELISEDEYALIVDRVALLFEGRVSGLVSRLRTEMLAASEARQFERAAGVRDRLASLQRSLERQSVVLPDLLDRDALGLHLAEDRACVQVFLVREGRLAGRQSYHLRTPADSTETDVLSAFLIQYYANASSIPREILLPHEVDEPGAAEAWLSELRGRRVFLKRPQRGEKRQLVEMANGNAKFALKGEERDAATREQATAALAELGEALSLSTFPLRIEAFDISNTQGDQATGSMVVFENGRPRRDSYRRFRVHLSGKPDDYAMMGEILRRRFRRGLAELNDPAVSRGKFSEFPDLLLIDGGKGQLNVAVAVLQEVNIEGIEVIGLAKRHEEVFRPGRSEPLILPADSAGLLLLRQVRDEAHRFAITYHRKLRTKRSLSSILDDIPGVGPKRKSELIKAFGSIERLTRASVESIVEKTTLPRGLAERVVTRLERTSR